MTHTFNLNWLYDQWMSADEKVMDRNKWHHSNDIHPPFNRRFLGYVWNEYIAFIQLGRTGDPDKGAGYDLAYFITYSPAEQMNSADVWWIAPEEAVETFPRWKELPEPPNE